jgi:hypothetical protein
MRNSDGDTLRQVHAVWPWRTVIYMRQTLSTSVGAQAFWIHDALSVRDAMSHAERVIASARQFDSGTSD